MKAVRLPFRMALVAACAAACASLGLTREARATLGGDVRSVELNEQHLGSIRRVVKLASGERHDLQLPSGMIVHEYVSPGGAVYAITWRGPRMPDLRELLGPYFSRLSGRDPGSGHHRVNVTVADLVLRSVGHRGSFSGRAWLPPLVPSSVHVDADLD